MQKSLVLCGKEQIKLHLQILRFAQNDNKKYINFPEDPRVRKDDTLRMTKEVN